MEGELAWKEDPAHVLALPFLSPSQGLIHKMMRLGSPVCTVLQLCDGSVVKKSKGIFGKGITQAGSGQFCWGLGGYMPGQVHQGQIK